jgi:hypothetical protein
LIGWIAAFVKAGTFFDIVEKLIATLDGSCVREANATARLSIISL